jgi:hypothetical protein
MRHDTCRARDKLFVIPMSHVGVSDSMETDIRRPNDSVPCRAAAMSRQGLWRFVRPGRRRWVLAPETIVTPDAVPPANVSATQSGVVRSRGSRMEGSSSIHRT